MLPNNCFKKAKLFLKLHKLVFQNPIKRVSLSIYNRQVTAFWTNEVEKVQRNCLCYRDLVQNKQINRFRVSKGILSSSITVGDNIFKSKLVRTSQKSDSGQLGGLQCSVYSPVIDLFHYGTCLLEILII